ncbi:extracellular solute-binding protein [Candidatus Parcubacteria bacterium]|nr:extracellular solute-binding protein [Candidatus Parcubacteria bacterium]
MNQMSPFQIILIAVFALAALAGIFLFANFGGGGGANGEVGTVEIWGTVPADAVNAGIQELTAGRVDYSDVSYVEKAEASFSRELADALASGAGPDLVILSQEHILTERAKLTEIPFATIPERTFIDSYASIFELFLTPTGTYAIPLVVDPLMLYYNRAMLSSAGIVSPPATWEAVAGLSSALSLRDAAGNLTRSTIPFGEYANVRNARGIVSLLLLQAGTSITAETEQGIRSVLGRQTGAGSFGSAPAESAMSYYTQFADPAKTVYSWNRALPSSRQSFIAGDLALYPGYASELPFIMAANPNLDFDVARIPQPGTASGRTTYALAYAFAIPRAADNSVGALQTAFALTADTPMRIIAEALSMAPAKRTLLVPVANDRYSSIFYPDALVARGWLSPAPSAVDGIFSAMIGNITSGRQDVADALQGAADALDAALR